MFEILDNASMWWPKKCDEEYRAAFERAFSVTAEDKQRFEAYAQVRKRNYPVPPDDGEAVNVFAPNAAEDPIASAFYGADTIEQALAALRPRLSAADLATLTAFYATYASRLRPWLDESAAYPAIAAALTERLARADVDATYRKMRGFYGVPVSESFTVLFVYWPPVDHTTANKRGRYLLMKYHPTQHRKGAESDVDIPVHELAHYLSSQQPEAQKRGLSAAFLSTCSPTPVEGPALLEEPLAVAQQKLFLSIAAPERFKPDAPWYGGKPWIGAFAKEIFPAVRERYAAGLPMDAEWIKALGVDCAPVAVAERAARGR